MGESFAQTIPAADRESPTREKESGICLVSRQCNKSMKQAYFCQACGDLWRFTVPARPVETLSTPFPI